jgi:hypothetical protein
MARGMKIGRGDFPTPADPVRTIVVCLRAAHNLTHSIDQQRGVVLREHIDQALLAIETEIPL